MTTRNDIGETHAKLIFAARDLFHEQGFHRTTLAHVAARASVRLGNVYHHFRTKDALAENVILLHVDSIHVALGRMTRPFEDPRARLKAYVRAPLEDAEKFLRFGCPHGGLCQELARLGPDAPLAKSSARMLGVYLQWTDEQFRALGERKPLARVRATELVAAVQGTLLLASVTQSRDVLASQLDRIERTLLST